MKYHVSENPAGALADRVVEILAASKAPTFAVSGGSTPRILFDELATRHRDALDWGRVQLFQVDERCVPPTHPDSNWAMIEDHLLKPIPEIRARRMEAERDGADREYERNLYIAMTETGGRIDVVQLGMGDDGHTASLFPGTAAIGERERWIVFNDVPQLNTRRMTMTYPIINAAAHKFFLAAGANKREALAAVKSGDLPAAGVTEAEWYLDTAAAGEEA